MATFGGTSEVDTVAEAVDGVAGSGDEELEGWDFGRNERVSLFHAEGFEPGIRECDSGKRKFGRTNPRPLLLNVERSPDAVHLDVDAVE